MNVMLYILHLMLLSQQRPTCHLLPSQQQQHRPSSLFLCHFPWVCDSGIIKQALDKQGLEAQPGKLASKGSAEPDSLPAADFDPLATVSSTLSPGASSPTGLSTATTSLAESLLHTASLNNASGQDCSSYSTPVKPLGEPCQEPASLTRLSTRRAASAPLAPADKLSMGSTQGARRVRYHQAPVQDDWDVDRLSSAQSIASCSSGQGGISADACIELDILGMADNLAEQQQLRAFVTQHLFDASGHVAPTWGLLRRQLQDAGVWSTS